MRRLVLAGLILLAAATPAAAKGPVALRLCGASECRLVTDREAVMAFSYWTFETASAAEPAPYYTVEVRWDGGPPSRLYWVPSAGVLARFYTAPSVTWFEVAPGGDAALRAAEGLESFPTPELTDVRVGGRRVAENPGSYLRLFAEERPAVVDSTETIRIALRSARPSPWTHGIHFYYPDSDVFETGLHAVKLPPDMAARVERAAPLESEAAAPFSTGTLAGGTFVALLLLAALLARRQSKTA